MSQSCPDECQEICELNRLRDLKTVGFTYMQDGVEQSAFLIYEDGEIYAYINRCPHVGVELNWQPDQFLSLDESSIQCSMHGAKFRIKDGFCHSGPCHGQSLQGIRVAICGEIVIICPSNK